VKISQEFTPVSLKAQLLFNAIFIFINTLLSPSKDSMYSQLTKVAVLSAATGPWHSTVPHHVHNGWLTGCLSKDQTGVNMMVQDQNSQAGVATPSI
jgi:hypothetical protein